MPVHERETVDRLLRRVTSLETTLTLLRAELQELSGRLDIAENSDRGPDLDQDHEQLDLGLERLFQPGKLNSEKPVKPYQTYLDCFWFGFDPAQKPPPEIYVSQVHGQGGADNDRRILSVDLHKRNQAKWLLMEFLLDWNQLKGRQQFTVVLKVRASHAVTLGSSFYLDKEDGESQMCCYQPLSVSQEFQTITADITLGPELQKKIRYASPPKLQLHLSNADNVRVDFADIRVYSEMKNTRLHTHKRDSQIG